MYHESAPLTEIILVSELPGLIFQMELDACNLRPYADIARGPVQSETRPRGWLCEDPTLQTLRRRGVCDTLVNPSLEWASAAGARRLLLLTAPRGGLQACGGREHNAGPQPSAILPSQAQRPFTLLVGSPAHCFSSPRARMGRGDAQTDKDDDYPNEARSPRRHAQPAIFFE